MLRPGLGCRVFSAMSPLDSRMRLKRTAMFGALPNDGLRNDSMTRDDQLRSSLHVIIRRGLALDTTPCWCSLDFLNARSFVLKVGRTCQRRWRCRCPTSRRAGETNHVKLLSEAVRVLMPPGERHQCGSLVTDRWQHEQNLMPSGASNAGTMEQILENDVAHGLLSISTASVRTTSTSAFPLSTTHLLFE